MRRPGRPLQASIYPTWCMGDRCHVQGRGPGTVEGEAALNSRADGGVRYFVRIDEGSVLLVCPWWQLEPVRA